MLGILKTQQAIHLCLPFSSISFYVMYFEFCNEAHTQIRLLGFPDEMSLFSLYFLLIQ